MSVSSEELNLLVYRYLAEGGETYKTLPGLRRGCFYWSVVGSTMVDLCLPPPLPYFLRSFRLLANQTESLASFILHCDF
jgi:hypothetical protein